MCFQSKRPERSIQRHGSYRVVESKRRKCSDNLNKKCEKTIFLPALSQVKPRKNLGFSRIGRKNDHKISADLPCLIVYKNFSIESRKKLQEWKKLVYVCPI